MYNALYFTSILYFAGGVHIINKNNVSLFFQTKKSHFSADFQGQEGVHIVHECTLCKPNHGTLCYEIRLKQIRSTSVSLHNLW